MRASVRQFGLFLLLLPKATIPQSFLLARNSRLSTLSNGWMFSFFLWKRRECGVVKEWRVLRTVWRGAGHFDP